jgi:HemY protein
VCASERLWGKAEAYLLGSLAAGDTVSARVALAQLYESINRPKDAALQFQLAARLALGERPPLPGPAAPAGSLAAGAMRGGDAGGDESGIFPPIAAPRGTLAAGAGAAAGAAAAAEAAGFATADSHDPDEAAAATAGDVGAVPAIARPDRQDLQDRAPVASAADTGSALPVPPSDAPSAVDLQTGPGDELGLVGRKE